VSRNDVILGVAALVLVVFSLVVSLVIPRRDPGFPGRNIRVFAVVAVLLVVAMLTAVEVFGGEDEAEGGEEAAHTESGATDTGATDTGQQGDGGGGADLAAGEEIFVANCGSCHTLSAAGTSGNIGPNLDDSSFDQGAVEVQVTNGGGGMPPFGGQLSEEEIRNVAAFVVASRGG
jgi:mono/diheme cytochrome c family protein